MAAIAGEKPFGTVMIDAFDALRIKIFEFVFPLDEYYTESHPIIDDERCRKEHGIRFVYGRIYDYDGNLDQEFNNEYSSDGIYVRSRIKHRNGTIIED